MPKTKMPMTIEGSPFIRSTTSWIGARTRGEANSWRKTAMQTPTGSAIAVAIPTRIAEPTISGAIPPPGWPKSGRLFVRNPHERSPAPRLAIDQTTIPSTATAASAAIVASHSAARLTILRRRTRRSPRSDSAGSSVAISALPPGGGRSGGRSAVRAGSSGARSQGGSRRGRRATRPGGSRPHPGTGRRSGLRACRLADRSPEPEDDGGGNAGARRREDDSAHHLPAGRPQGERTFFQLLGHAQKELATDARHDRHDHDRQDQAGDEDAARRGIAAEDRDEAEPVVERGLDVVGDEGPHHEDAPEAEDDARNRREHLDECTDQASHAARRELAQEERDRKRERRGDDERDQRRDRGAIEARRSAEDALVRIPDRAPQERDPERAEGEMRAADDLVGDRDHHGDRGQRGAERQQQEHPVAEPVANPAAALEPLRQGNGAHRAGTLTRES